MTFQFDFTQAKLAACIRNPKIADWYEPLYRILPEYAINNKNRVAAWLAQCGHESGDFRVLSENLNYGAPGLRATFPRQFPTQAIADSYHRQPERIANRAYANKIGNGDEASGDGWRFRGRGVIQVTGRANYRNCSLALYGTEILLTNPDILLTIDGAIRSACWYWNSRQINDDADRRDIAAVTKKINAASLHLSARAARFESYLRIL